MLPALSILRHKESDALRQGRTVTESREQNRTRSVLVVAEVALSMLLVAGALNMALYFTHLLRVDPGVNPQNVLSVGVSLSPAQYSEPGQQSRFFNVLLDKVSVLPGVIHAGASIDTPFSGANSNGDFTYEGEPNGTADHKPFADQHYISPGYFATVETPILEGRDFSRQDQPNSQKVILINRGMAQKLWPGQNAIGKHIKCCRDDGNYEVIGVIADVHFAGPGTAAGYELYLSADQSPVPALSVLLRTSGDPLSFAEAVRHAVSSIDPGQAVSNITSLDALAQQSIAGQRTATLITAILGCLALLLASVGVYGVMAYSVSRREREFGIRMALGAKRGDIASLLFRGALSMVLVGVILGGVLAILLRVWVTSLLGANGTNPVALIVAAVLLVGVACLATFVPARRATHIEPMQALRAE
jgi:putative ABC transport system permease protein